MSDWPLVALFVGALLFFAGWSLWRMGRDMRAARSKPAPAPTVAASAPQRPRTLEDLAAALSPVYEASAHPQHLEGHPDFQLGVAWLADRAVPLDQAASYAAGANMLLAAIANAALRQREDSAAAAPRVIEALGYANAWVSYFMLRFLAERADGEITWVVLGHARDWWARHPLMPHFLREFLEARLARGERLDPGAALEAAARDNIDEIEASAARIEGAAGEQLRAALARWRAERIDVRLLDSVGRVWEAGRPDLASIVTDHLEEQLDAALAALDARPPASMLVVGEAGVGKTAFIHALGARLMQQGWTLFEASAADIIAGQSFIGELEQRMRLLFSSLAAERRVAWYVPAFHELFYSGRHRYSPVGVLDLLLPAVEAGRLCVIGEVRPAPLEKVLQQQPRLRHAFRVVNLEPLPGAEAMALARAVQSRSDGVTIADAVLADAFDLARHYMSGSASPGNLLELLEQAQQRVRAQSPAGHAVTREDLLATLARMTGLPHDVLDDRPGLDRGALRAFFERRVMGQPEAVDCLVDRIVMLKAGLTDPNRPIGVFLFAGPTGTGKTEVAKTLAEYLFGSSQRMIRLDMSEFQEPHALARIVGEPGESAATDALVNRIRKQPFSVVLLDEFEKAHPRVWDLFLQVFDDARLTDANGNLADFRHSIIILTSNLGAAEHRGGSLGFTTREGQFSDAQVQRVIADTFRPEFVNRIDRVVVFRPLARTVMRDILKKELAAVLGRRGFRSREWAVEWEESALEFLLDRGFTRDMGARPLRRAIDQHVLAPIATTIVEHRFPEGDQFLFVRSNGEAIEVEFVDPDATPEPAAPVTPQPGGFGPLIRAASGSEAERIFLEAALARIEHRLADGPWQSEKAALLDQMRRQDFWSSGRRHAVLAQIEHRDSIEAAARAAQSLLKRISSRSARNAPPAIVANLAQQLYLLEQALLDLDRGLWPDLFLAVEPVAGEPGAQDEADAWTMRIGEMYMAWSRKRRMRAALLAPHPGAEGFVLAVSGFGAHGILQREAGLHVLEVPDAQGGFARRTARVRVAAQPAQPRPANQGELGYALACLSTSPASNSVVRRYREAPSPLVRDALAGWRSGRLADVLGGDFDLMEG
jgi:ATP-dependent Clp protease ATP-binding subunit ClpC